MDQYSRIVDLWQSYEVLSAADLDKYLDSFRILFAFHSGKIENDEITYNDTREIFENGRVVSYTGSPRALFEQQNQKLCYEFLKVKIVKKEPLSMEQVREIHRVLTSGTYDERRYIEKEERPGEFKKYDYVTGIHEVGSVVDSVENDLMDLIAEVNEYEGGDVLKAAAYLHAKFEFIHPFADGNGRVGRALMNYYLMTHNHPPLTVYDEDKKLYYECLQKYDEAEELNPLYEFLKFEMEKTWDKVLALSDGVKTERKSLLEKCPIDLKVEGTMENTGRRDALQHNARLLTTLLDVSNLVSSTMDLQPLLEAILDKLKSIIEYKNAKIFTVSGTQVKIIAHRSELTVEQESYFPFPLGMKLVLDKKPVVIDDLYAEDELAVTFRNNMGKYMESVFKGVHCWMSLPMVAKDKVIGVLTLDHNTAGFYKAHHIELGAAFANQAAIEYENAKLYNETVKKADEIKTMFNIQQAITSRLELDAVLKLIADEARRLSNAHSTAVFLVDGEELVLSVFSGEHHNGLIGLRLPTHDSAIGESLLQKESIILEYSQLEQRPEHELIATTEMHTCLCVPLLAGSRAVGVIAAFSRNEGEFDSEDERIFNMFAPSAVIGIENARLYQEEIRRHLDDEQRRHVAEGLRDILAVLNSNRSLDEILDFLIREAARLLHTDSAALYRLHSDKNTLVLEAACGLPHLTPEVTSGNIGVGVLGKAFMGRKPVVKTDISELDSMLNGISDADNHLDWLRANCAGLIAVPLICKDEVYGGIALYIKKDEKQPKHNISKEDIDLAMTFADQAALAIDNTRLRKQAEDMAVAAERNRLARDLHDAVTQTLFSASLIAEVLPRIWERSREDGLKRLDELRQLTRGALAEMRTLLFELRPATLVEAPLEELLRQLSEAITGRARVPVTLNINGTVRLPTEVKIAFYRIAQEALNNIAKHSGAQKATVELKVNEDKQLGIIIAEMFVTDDGRGFEPGKVTSEHFGIGIMRERAEATGAKLKVDSKAGRGTTIELEWVGSK